MKKYETPTALLLDINKQLEKENKKLRKDIDLAYRFLLSNEVPKGFTNIRVTFKVKADPRDIEQIKQLANYSPMLNTISQGTMVNIEVQPK